MLTQEMRDDIVRLIDLRYRQHAAEHLHGSADFIPLLTIEETDGSPSIRGIHKLIVTTGDLTDPGDGTALLATGGGGGGAPTTADYLVGTAQAGLSAEIVVGTSPGGELGGTWASPTVDASHSGSAHHDAKQIIDDDADTYVDTEVSADSDVIESASAGTVRSRLSALGLQLANGTDLLMYSDAFTTLKGTWDAATGHMSLGGSTAPSATVPLLIVETFADPAAQVDGLRANPSLSMTAGNSQVMNAFTTAMSLSGAFTHSGIISGTRSQLQVVSGATANDFRNFYALAVVNAGTTMVDRYGIYIANATGSGSVTNQYGVYIENMAKGGALNRAIHSLGGISTHLGAFSIGHNNAPASTAILDLATAVTGVGVRLPAQTTANAPASSDNGTLWYDSTTNKFRGRENGADVDIRSAGSGHTIQDDNSSMTARTNLSFQDGFVVADDAGGDQTEIDVSYGAAGYPQDVATSESDGTAITVARSDHVHKAAYTGIAVSGMKRQITLTAGSALPTVTTTPGLSAQRFETAANDIVYMGLPMSAAAAGSWAWAFPAPLDWDLGTVTFQVHWTPSDSSGDVVFQMRGVAVSNDDALDGTAMGSYATVTDTMTTALDLHVTADSGALTIAGMPALGDHLFLELKRDPAHASDTHAGSLRILAVVIKYGVTSLGVS